MSANFAVEATLQPIERFGFDAAIVFSDILVVPFALGYKIDYEGDTGPRLTPAGSGQALIDDPHVWMERLAPCYEAVRIVRSQLDEAKALLGFAGGPWTLATYMVEGGSSVDQRSAKLWGYRDPKAFRVFLDVVGTCIAEHLVAQLRAGADAVQIFDSWASGLPEQCFDDWVISPTRRVVQQVRKACPAAKIIGFPRGAILPGYERYAAETGVDAISLDTSVPIRWAVEKLGGRVALQGNLDPIALAAGGDALRRSVATIMAAAQSTPFVFNLGHGVVPETPLEHVAALVRQVRGTV